MDGTHRGRPSPCLAPRGRSRAGTVAVPGDGPPLTRREVQHSRRLAGRRDCGFLGIRKYPILGRNFDGKEIRYPSPGFMTDSGVPPGIAQIRGNATYRISAPRDM